MAEEKTYDYVIVGAGSAGCVLANRLTEDAGATVLLLEAGGNDNHPYIQIPLGIGKIHAREMFDWGYFTEAEAGLTGRSIEAMRGKILGGSSSVNMTGFTRGDRGDFDRWAANGASGWSYEDVLPYFKKLETWEDGESTTRGGSGPIGVQWARLDDPISDAWMRAGNAFGIPENTDYSSGDMFGFGRAQCTVRNGRRSSSTQAYLKPARHRSNLTVATHALALRVLMQGTRAVGVEYRAGSGEVLKARATREVILSAGVFNTPQILMLSGIGPAAHLRDLGLSVLGDLPVGKNLQDHQAVVIAYARKQRGTFHSQMRFDRMARNMLQAAVLRTGYATQVPIGILGFVKTSPQLPVPDLEYMFPTAPRNAHVWFPGIKKAYDDVFAIRPAILHPQSRGEVLLRSSNPADRVRIHFNFFSNPRDIETLRRGFKMARELARRRELDEFRGAELTPGGSVNTDAEIDAYIRKTMLTVHHPAGTCPIGESTDSVVGSDLRVHGFEQLRIVDASTMPDLVSGHINACVIMMAERAADLIRNCGADAITRGTAISAQTPQRMNS